MKPTPALAGLAVSGAACVSIYATGGSGIPLVIWAGCAAALVAFYAFTRNRT